MLIFGQVFVISPKAPPPYPMKLSPSLIFTSTLSPCMVRVLVRVSHL